MDRRGQHESFDTPYGGELVHRSPCTLVELTSLQDCSSMTEEIAKIRQTVTTGYRKSVITIQLILTRVN